MKQAIAGVAPAESGETTVMVVWPSIARYSWGCWLGGLFGIRTGYYIFTLGNLLALASIPLALALYGYRVVAGSAYRLTNRRVVELRHAVRGRAGFPFWKFTFGEEVRSIGLDQFDTIEIDRRPGQSWFDAGDLVFKLGDSEAFRLQGVSRPEPFRQTCLKSRLSHVAVKQVLSRQAVPA